MGVRLAEGLAFPRAKAIPRFAFARLGRLAPFSHWFRRWIHLPFWAKA